MRRQFTAIVLGLLSVNEMASGAPTIARSPGTPSRVAVRKPLPQSRLVRPKTVAQSSPVAEEEPPLFLDEPATRPLRDSLRAEALPDDPPMEESARDVLLDDPAPRDEQLEEPSLDVRAAPAPETTEPLDVAPQPSVPSVPPAVEVLPPPANTGRIFRLEPPQKLVPVAASELKPGVIYLRDDIASGRQVWSFVQANGQFWRPFGPGTTQSIGHFDFRISDDEATERLEKLDPRLAFDVSSQNVDVFLRLQSDNTWKLVRHSSVPSIFDATTQQRWEKQWGEYLPVTHNCGDTWVWRDGQYWAPNWTASMKP